MIRKIYQFPAVLRSRASFRLQVKKFDAALDRTSTLLHTNFLINESQHKDWGYATVPVSVLKIFFMIVWQHS
jgi:hypothetical protein